MDDDDDEFRRAFEPPPLLTDRVYLAQMVERAREYACYLRNAQRLARRAPGKFVLIMGDSIELFDSLAQAISAGNGLNLTLPVPSKEEAAKDWARVLDLGFDPQQCTPHQALLSLGVVLVPAGGDERLCRGDGQ